MLKKLTEEKKTHIRKENSRKKRKLNIEIRKHFVHCFSCGDKEFMDNCVRKAVIGKETNHKGQGLFVTVKLLKGDVKQVGVMSL